MASKSNRNEKAEYDMRGAYYSAQNPNIITGFVLEDTKTGSQFRASVVEAKELHRKGKLNVPDSFE